MANRTVARRVIQPAGFSGARCAYGLVLLLAADRIARAIGASGEAGVVRLLGIRHLVQAGLTAAADDRARLRDGAVVDAAHSLSMVAVAAISPSRRRPAALSAATAAGWAIAGILVGRHAPERPAAS